MSCILCGSTKQTVIRTRLRHNIEQNVLQCECGLVGLEASDVLDYSTEYRQHHGPVLGKASDPAEVFRLSLPMQAERIETLKPHLSGARVLDVGCSAGQLLNALKPFVAECVGLEINHEEAAHTRGLGFHVVEQPIESVDLEPFDVITATDVIEHVPDPVAFLAAAKRLLKPNGIVYVETPNLNDALLSQWQVPEYADFWFRVPHLWYFSKDTLSNCAERAGLRATVTTRQHYTLINHLSWIMGRGPQKNVTVGTSLDWLTDNELADWLKEVDRDYKLKLEHKGLGDALVMLAHAG